MSFPNDKRAIRLALTAVLLWSTVATAFKLSLRYLTPLELLLISSLTSWVFLTIALFWQREFTTLKMMPTKEIGKALMMGVLNPFLYYLVLFRAYDLLPAQVAQSVNYTWALLLAYLSVIFLRQPLTSRDITAGFLGYGGVVLIATQGNFSAFKTTSAQGLAYALLSTFLWSLYWLLMTKNRNKPIVNLFLNFSAASALILVAMFVYPVNEKNLPAEGFLAAIYVGLFEMGLTFVIWLSALQQVSRTAKISNLIFLSPFLSLVFIRFFLKEEILPTTLIGLGLIVGGLIWQRGDKGAGDMEGQ